MMICNCDGHHFESTVTESTSFVLSNPFSSTGGTYDIRIYGSECRESSARMEGLDAIDNLSFDP